jgi:N-acetylmuramoyl-L-alanine amidase
MTYTVTKPLRTLAAVLAGLAWLALAAPVEAQTAAVRYQRAMAREKAARAATAPSLATRRRVATAYEGIVRAYPRSGYCDNALWQAAGLLALAHERRGAAADLAGARRMLAWLKREYPTSSLARQVDRRLATLRTPPKPAPAKPAQPRAAVAAASAPPAAEPVPVPPPLVSSAGPSAPAPAAARGAAVSVKDILHSTLPRGERLTIEMTGEAIYSASRTANPDRLMVDLSNAAAASALAARAAAIGGALVTAVDVAAHGDGATRLVLRLDGDPRFSTFPLYNPFRLVIDLESTTAPAPAAARERPVPQPMPTAGEPAPRPPASTAPVALASAPPPAPPAPPAAPSLPAQPPAPAPEAPASTSRGDYSIARQLGLAVSRVVIDPGHGGHDPGARANGVTEADVVLDVALRLEKLLGAQPDVDVVLTRRTNAYVPLEERTAIANREQADMFLSIHVNSSPRVATRGVETYLLDFASTPDAEALAARENASSAQTMRLLPEIVKTITLTNKLDESRELAGMVQGALVKRLRPVSAGLKDLGVKRAPFVVLIGAEMPSVLAEISFLSNRTDAALLKQPGHRQRIAQALADAVLLYRASLKAAPAGGARAAAR